MKICVLTHTFPRFKDDTAAPFMDGVAGGLVAAGNEVFVLTPYSSSFDMTAKREYKLLTYKYIWPESLHKMGYSQVLTNDKALKLSMYLLAPFMYFFGTLALIRLILKEKIDIISAHWILPNGFIGCMATLFTGVPTVSTLPGSDVLMVRKNELFRLMGVFATRMSKAVTSNSPQLLKDLEDLTRSKFRSEAIIYGVDPARFKANISKSKSLRRSLNIPSDNVVVVGVGRLVEKKGFVHLIKAASLLKDKVKKVTYVIVGDGDQKQELEDLIKTERVENLFRLPGAISYNELIHYYNLSDMFILPSVRDESGNLDDQSVAAIEAMACGKPVICTNFPGYRITIKQGVNGYLTKEADPKSIALALEKLIKDRKLREKMSKEARRFAEEEFSWKGIGKQYSELFQKLLNK